MRIAIIRQRYNPFGGAERFVERALRALGSRDLDVTLITRQWDTDAHADSPYRVLCCAPFHVGRLWRDRAFCRAAQRLIAQHAFDLVQSHERIPGCDVFRAGDGVHATWLAARARTLSPAGRLAQWLSPWHRYTLASEAAMFRHPALSAIICNSQMVARDIAARFPQTAGKLHIVHNGVDLQRFSPALRARHRPAVRAHTGVDDATPVLIHVGSGFARKGVPQMIEALTHPALRRAHLWVIGKDRQEATLRRRTTRLGVADRVRFLGPQADVAPFLSAADVFVLPTLYDPMPNAALEALATGLPVLTSTLSGAAELIGQREQGAVVDALDIEAIAAEAGRLLEAVADKPFDIAHLCRSAVEHLSNEDMASRQLALYEKLLASGGV